MAPPLRGVLDPNRISDGRAQPRASPSPNPRAVPSPVTTFSQAAGRPQQAEGISRFYSPPPQETRYTPPLGPSLTGSTESGDPYRPSSRHAQFDKSASLLNLTGVSLPASQPSNPSTHAAERGRRTEISSVANAAPSRDTSSEHSDDDSGVESSDDDEGPDQTPDQRNDPSSLAGGAEVTQQRIKPVGGDQHTEFTDSANTHASRDSPTLSLDLSTTTSINSSDSSTSPPRDPQSKPLGLVNHGSDVPPPEQLAEEFIGRPATLQVNMGPLLQVRSHLHSQQTSWRSRRMAKVLKMVHEATPHRKSSLVSPISGVTDTLPPRRSSTLSKP
jgi:hypothetical protein